MHQQVSGQHRDVSTDKPMWSRVVVLPAALMLGVFLVFLDLAYGGFLLKLDEAVRGIWMYQGPYGMDTADLFDRIGQRTICLPLLFGIAWWISRKIESIRPLLLALGGTLFLNFFVGVVKLITARQSPRTGGPTLFDGNNLFPSGHTANVVFVYGLMAALIIRYGDITLRQKMILVFAVLGIFVFMVSISVYRHTHWFTDLVAGGMVGWAVLHVCMSADSYWPTFRAWARRSLGPAWAGVEWCIQRLRPLVMRRSQRLARRAEVSRVDSERIRTESRDAEPSPSERSSTERLSGERPLSDRTPRRPALDQARRVVAAAHAEQLRREGALDDYVRLGSTDADPLSPEMQRIRRRPEPTIGSWH